MYRIKIVFLAFLSPTARSRSVQPWSLLWKLGSPVTQSKDHLVSFAQRAMRTFLKKVKHDGPVALRNIVSIIGLMHPNRPSFRLQIVENNICHLNDSKIV